jgi:hypothetical protein
MLVNIPVLGIFFAFFAYKVEKRVKRNLCSASERTVNGKAFSIRSGVLTRLLEELIEIYGLVASVFLPNRILLILEKVPRLEELYLTWSIYVWPAFGLMRQYRSASSGITTSR